MCVFANQIVRHSRWFHCKTEFKTCNNCHSLEICGYDSIITIVAVVEKMHIMVYFFYCYLDRELSHWHSHHIFLNLYTHSSTENNLMNESPCDLLSA